MLVSKRYQRILRSIALGHQSYDVGGQEIGHSPNILAIEVQYLEVMQQTTCS